MEIIKKRIADMERAEYNPRVELMPGDDEYEKLKRNIDRFGVVVPVIWNKRTNRVVSGHQRLTVLMNEGVTETDVSVVDLDETAEKQLNIAMNKVTGEWDEVKLKELLDEDAGDTNERFGLFWQGKKRAMRAAQDPTTATLKPAKDLSKDWDSTENIFIEGDNLEVLKVLQKQYRQPCEQPR